MSKKESNLFPEHQDFTDKEWNGMPEFNQENLAPIKQLIVSFKSYEDYKEFAEIIDQPLTTKTKSVWYPKAEIGLAHDKRYSATNKKK